MGIPVTRSSMPPFEEYVEEIRELWDSRWLTNAGIKHRMLGERLKEYLHVSSVVLFANGHLALEAVLEAMELTGEVITVPFTFASTTHAIARKGLTPVFCDISPETYTIDASKIEPLITEKTSAIVPVHVYGAICDVERIEIIARKNNLKVIYDAAHAFGVSVNGKTAAEFGDASMFSFHATKVFHTAEGGAVALNNNDKELENRLSSMINFGIIGDGIVPYAGLNAKMSEFHAAMGICNLRHLDEEIGRRRAVAERYRENLSGCKGITLLERQRGVSSNYAYFPVLFEKDRDGAADRLARENIFARKYFYPLTNDFECYKNMEGSQNTPVARDIADRVLTLPIYSDLSISEVDKICGIINKHR